MKTAMNLDAIERRRASLLAALSVINVLCAAFFTWDAVGDFESLAAAELPQLLAEAVASACLVIASVLFLYELRRLIERNSAMAIGIRAARGEMSVLIERFFAEWQLSDAEWDIALLLLKGLDNKSIAAVRGTATGTVRAQCASIYDKAGVDSRSQLMSVFLEELLSEPLVAQPQKADAMAE